MEVMGICLLVWFFVRTNMIQMAAIVALVAVMNHPFAVNVAGIPPGQSALAFQWAFTAALQNLLLGNCPIRWEPRVFLPACDAAFLALAYFFATRGKCIVGLPLWQMGALSFVAFVQVWYMEYLQDALASYPQEGTLATKHPALHVMVGLNKISQLAFILSRRQGSSLTLLAGLWPLVPPVLALFSSSSKGHLAGRLHMVLGSKV